MSEFKGKTVIVVNAASKCGLTPQYEGLEKHYREYKDNGLVVLGFPCNQFANQESGSAGEIEEFCQVNYGVTFPMFAKFDVNGYGAHPLFKYLKNESGSLFGSKVKWNFTKEVLYLENQICFPLYAASRLTNQLYTPLLKEMGLTYPQYLVMLVLWQHKNLTVNEICSKLILETNTVTPLLKRLEQKGSLLFHFLIRGQISGSLLWLFRQKFWQTSMERRFLWTRCLHLKRLFGSCSGF